MSQWTRTAALTMPCFEDVADTMAQADVGPSYEILDRKVVTAAERHRDAIRFPRRDVHVRAAAELRAQIRTRMAFLEIHAGLQMRLEQAQMETTKIVARYVAHLIAACRKPLASWRTPLTGPAWVPELD